MQPGFNLLYKFDFPKKSYNFEIKQLSFQKYKCGFRCNKSPFCSMQILNNKTKSIFHYFNMEGNFNLGS